MSEILYATADTVPAKIDGVRVLVLVKGMWFLNHINEPLFIADVYNRGHMPRKLCNCVGFDYEAVAAELVWVEIQ